MHIGGTGTSHGMRIWLAPSAFFPHIGGIEELTAQLGRRLQDRGHDVLVITNQYDESLPLSDSIDGLRVERVRYPVPRRTVRAMAGVLVASVTMLRRLRRYPKPDVIHLHGISNQTLPLLVFGRISRVPVVVSTHGETDANPSGRAEMRRYGRFVVGRAVRHAAALTVPSSWLRDHVALTWPGFRDAEVIPNAVEPTYWFAGGRSSEPKFAMVGRLAPEKGFDLVLNAWKLVRAQLPSARLLIAGEGPEEPRLRALASDGVDFRGRLDREGVRALYQEASVVVAPSRFEAFGIVALEAIAADRGLVVSTEGALAEVAGTYATVVDPSDAHALAEGMCTTLTRGTDDAARELVLGTFDWDDVTSRYVAVYRAVLR